MKTKTQLINNIIGQLRGVSEMIEEERDCFATFTQMKAARSALNNLMNKYLEENFMNCIGKCRNKQEKDDVCKKFFAEIIKNS